MRERAQSSDVIGTCISVCVQVVPLVDVEFVTLVADCPNAVAPSYGGAPRLLLHISDFIDKC